MRRGLAHALAGCRVPVLLHGAMTGWTAALLIAGAELVTFEVLPPRAGIISACAASGYPKQADYVWYALMLAGGLAGAAVNARLAAFLRSRPPAWQPIGRGAGWLAPAGAVCLAAAAAHGARLAHPASWPAWALLAAGWALPWGAATWRCAAPPATGPEAAGPPVPGLAWAAGAAGIAVVWIYDSCLPFRPIDGLHEGGQLIYVQSWLAGDLPGLGTRTQYGPLYAHSLAWWTAWHGSTMSAARGYFLAVQMAGTALHLWLLRATVRRCWPLATGAWLMLTLTTAPNIQYGWGNALRTALPLTAVWLAAGRRPAMAGAWAALAWLYSQEYGVAGLAGCAAALWVEPEGSGLRARLRSAGSWAGGVVTAAAAGLLLMFGGRALAAARHSVGGGYALARLLGHAVSPLPAFPWWESWPQFLAGVPQLLPLAAIWGPGMLAVAVVARLPRWRHLAPARAAWLGGLTAFTLLAQLPVLARPLWQIAAAMPAAILLGAAAADLLLTEAPAARWLTRCALAAAGAYGVAIFMPMAVPLTSKAACFGVAPGPAAPPELGRLGTVRVSGEPARELAMLVRAIRERTPAGARVYLAAPRHAYACFLADRAPLAPLALTYLAATRDERRSIVAALERQPPPLAMLTDAGLDLPYPTEHPEEWAWLRARYRLDARIGEVQLWVPAVRPQGPSRSP